ncbi:MAG: hypothetical protein COS48_02105 [Candidatus Omnitrophica bacterium CG03_land_8_20_14_0_80_43_22]|nr:MAG: hypothetical protein COS48_02105 [Candidatus Omnitrophica bacterium CG03_land_8_20_14_0_80_43_22]
MMHKNVKKIFAILISLSVCLGPGSSIALQPQPGQVDLAIARGCYLYDSGNMKEAMMEFEMILRLDPDNKAAKEYIDKIWRNMSENGISEQELQEQINGYKNAVMARKKIEVTDAFKPVIEYRRKPYKRFINQTTFGYNNRDVGNSADPSFNPDGFFIAEHVRMDDILRAQLPSVPKKMPKPRRGLDWNEFIFDATSSYDPDDQELSFYWDFGDGETSNLPVVRHKYEKEGDYTVILTVIDSSELACNTATAQRQIKVYKAIEEPAPDEVFMKPLGEEWQSNISIDARYHDNSHEDARLRRIMYSLSNPNGAAFIAGDTSTNFSRYTLRGLYYRGVNYALKNDDNEFRILWGAVPHFLARTQQHTNRDNGYIYPRKVFGARDLYKVSDRYKIGVSYMELKDSERVRMIDPNYNPKLNRVYSVEQHIDVAPETWKIKTENAYSTSDEDRTDKDILVTDEKLKDFAHYIYSSIQVPKFRLINSYERIGSDFRSYSDLAATTTTWLAGITSDREKIENYLEYRPFNFDPIYIDMNFSRIRNNLDRDNEIETNRQTNYGGALRFVPEMENWLPQSAIRLKFMNTLSVPGSEYASNDVSDRDIIFELAKQLYGVDLNTSYTRRRAVDNIETFETYTNIYNIRMAKELTDMVLFSTEYMHSNTQKDQDGSEGTIGRQNYFNVSTALYLWAGSNLSFGYSYQADSDKTGMLQDKKANIYSTTFSWPFSRYFFESGAQLNFTPYFTYQLDDNRDVGNRSVWTAACDATYQMSKDHRISASFLYREDQDDSLADAGTEDRRFLLTYKKIFQ